MGFIEEPAAPLQPLPPLVGVIDFDIGVLGLSSNFLVDGVLALDEVPLRGLKKKEKKTIFVFRTNVYTIRIVLYPTHIIRVCINMYK